ncbi:GNAT family N-acetyltransferase [Spirillospora sp. NPDC050679]
MTYVEMTSPDQCVPAAPVPGLVLEPLDRDSPLVTDVMARIGAPYGWKSASRTEEEWAAWFERSPERVFWLLSFEGEPAGMASYEARPGGEVEIGTFGLLPEFVGKGLGGYALTIAIRRAWELVPAVTRVWLHTSSLDHPNALPNYHRRGFRTFRTEEGERDVP